jgi:SPX domain protein involved in polyphosphate accumulation
LVLVADRWKGKIESYHDVFVEREKHRSDESRRPEQSRSSDLLGFEGTFRKLEID